MQNVTLSPIFIIPFHGYKMVFNFGAIKINERNKSYKFFRVATIIPSVFNRAIALFILLPYLMPIINYKSKTKRLEMSSVDIYYYNQQQMESQGALYPLYQNLGQQSAAYVPYVEPYLVNQAAIYMASPQKNKIKTSLCKKWAEFGSCPYLHKCQFAHGIQQLRCNVDENSYKTKECNAFFKKGYCPYGFRCNFSHKAVKNSEDFEGQNCKQSQSILRGYRQVFESIKKREDKNRIFENTSDEGDSKSISSTQDCRSESLSRSRLGLQEEYFQGNSDLSAHLFSQPNTDGDREEKQEQQQMEIDEGSDLGLLLFNIDQFY